MNKVIRRVIGLIPAILIQLLWLYALMRWLSPYAALINLLLSLFAVLYVLHIITNRNESTYIKLPRSPEDADQPLLEAGVKIYEYTPGFVHAKGCVIDDVIGTIGTVNLDYRSLFLHFENNALFYQAPILKDLKADFLSTQTQCRERTLDNIGVSFKKWVADGLLRIFAPLC